ncbi:MAG: hypothetical protein GQ532_18255 [Methylomarinum sp.]|nr:hypothetical protein [Methylomarinum sp.]
MSMTDTTNTVYKQGEDCFLKGFSIDDAPYASAIDYSGNDSQRITSLMVIQLREVWQLGWIAAGGFKALNLGMQTGYEKKGHYRICPFNNELERQDWIDGWMTASISKVSNYPTEH